ncbi:cation:dicarboxylate symporter family transporter [Ramlibacter albus]|uniref:Cation:dicarboxylase symporter family transporter n=1 Tax=Ramlibacter albus TaxID=2079448 RepID=A0A923M611_9BURK|nr:cation:dicarboxylase symporter family transporter [Ramlibacter albus]MBC5764493.1 cation:dicarboxylase symporter family transporter [Ramlibacter albus]
MGFLLTLVRHPMFLFVSLALGVGAWAIWPGIAKPLSAVSFAYLSLLNMGAVPLLVVAVFLGVRRMFTLPQAIPRLLALAFGGALVMFFAALVGASLADLTNAGGSIPPQDIRKLGSMSLTSESIASVSLKPDDNAAPVEKKQRAAIDNFFAALAFGSLPAILICALFFAVAFAAQPHAKARGLQAQFEPIYRTLELLIDRLNDFLPVVAFALAASIASAASSDGMALMQSFLLPYFATVLVAVMVAAYAMALHVGQSPFAVLEALRKPIVVSLFASGPAAAIPGFIQAMCNELGFRRDLVEFTAPLAPAFLRVGEAVFFAVMAVFVANLYGRDPVPSELVVIALASTAAAFISVNVTGVKSLAVGSVVLAYLDLPIDALLPAFVIAEVVCEGPRNVLSMLMAGALLAVVSRGLPSEQAPKPMLSTVIPSERVRVVLTRGRAAVATVLVGLCMATVYLAGVGAGARKAQSHKVPDPTGVKQPARSN